MTPDLVKCEPQSTHGNFPHIKLFSPNGIFPLMADSRDSNAIRLHLQRAKSLFTPSSLRVMTHLLSILSSVTHFAEVLMKVLLLVSESTSLLEPTCPCSWLVYWWSRWIGISEPNSLTRFAMFHCVIFHSSRCRVRVKVGDDWKTRCGWHCCLVTRTDVVGAVRVECIDGQCYDVGRGTERNQL